MLKSTSDIRLGKQLNISCGISNISLSNENHVS